MTTTYADSGQPLGTSRNTTGLTPVHITAWGATAEDAELAAMTARQDERARFWRITGIDKRTGVPCPIPRHDPGALAQRALYDWAYTVHPANPA